MGGDLWGIPRKSYTEDWFGDTAKVYKVEEADRRYYYVAENMLAALELHFGTTEEFIEEEDELTIRLVPADRTLFRIEEQGVKEDFPDTFQRHADGGKGKGIQVSSTAAEWAYFYKDSGAVLVMSSEY